MDNTIHFNMQNVFEGTVKFTYRNVPCLKSPMDYALYQKLLFETEPDLIIEIGTNCGGSALYMADLMDTNKKGIIHTIDINYRAYEIVKHHPRIKFFNEGWKNYSLENAVGFKKIIVIDDGSHLYEDVQGVLNKFKNLISKDSYFIIEDGIIDELGWKEQYGGAPLKAIEEFLKGNENFLVDRTLCDFFGKNNTFNVNGYLKKIN